MEIYMNDGTNAIYDYPETYTVGNYTIKIYCQHCGAENTIYSENIEGFNYCVVCGMPIK